MTDPAIVDEMLGNAKTIAVLGMSDQALAMWTKSSMAIWSRSFAATS